MPSDGMTTTPSSGYAPATWTPITGIKVKQGTNRAGQPVPELDKNIIVYQDADEESSTGSEMSDFD